MKEPTKINPEHVLCPSCNKPIHIDEFAMVTKEGLYHGNAVCLASGLIKREKDEKGDKGVKNG